MSRTVRVTTLTGPLPDCEPPSPLLLGFGAWRAATFLAGGAAAGVVVVAATGVAAMTGAAAAARRRCAARLRASARR
jgi:hypothetical protein